MEHIQLPAIYIKCMITAMLIFIVAIFYNYSKYEAVKIEDEISLMYARKYTFSAIRGNPVYFDDYKYLTNCKLINYPCDFSYWQDNADRKNYELRDLILPFKISKEKNSDLLIVYKANCKLEFLIEF